MFPSYLEVEKTGSQLFRALQTLLQLFGQKKSGSLLFGDQKMQFTTVRSKEKDYNIYLQSVKLVHIQQEHEKKCFPALWKWKKLVPSYFEPDKHCCSYLEREKSGSVRFGDQKMQFTTVRSQEKDYDIISSQKNWFTASRITKKMFSIYLEVEKTGSQLFRA